MAVSSPTEPHPAEPLIGGSFAVDLGAPLPEFGGGQPCFAVRDHAPATRSGGKRDLMAVQVDPTAPPRPLALTALASSKIENVLLPWAHGRAATAQGGQAWFVVMPQPGGPAVWPAGAQAITPWSESELLGQLIRPAALMLEQIEAAGLTHRAIRPNNVFRPRGHQAVTFGAAWAAPPGFWQPAAFEPPYSAACHRAGRGEGVIADDIYALGVLMLALASGKMPMEGMDEDSIIRKKLDRGSFAALAADLRLSPSIADLARVMLAEDPDHRPPPALLGDPLAARARRVAARPPARAPRKLDVGAQPVWEARGLAFALSREPEAAVRLLRGHAVDVWLRRALSDHAAATAIEEAVRHRAAETGIEAGKADALLVMHAVAVLDPLAPLCWRGACLFPDGVGPLLAAAQADGTGLTERIEAMLSVEAIGSWSDLRPGAASAAALRLDARQMRMMLRIAGWSGGMARLRYTLNPLLACASPLLAGRCVVRLNDLLPDLERHAATGGVDMLIDRDISGFISARFSGRMDGDFTILAQPEDPAIDPPGHHGLAQLRVLTRLGEFQAAARWPHLAACAARLARHSLKRWRSRSARQSREAALQDAVSIGSLPAMLAVLHDVPGLAEDSGKAVAIAREISRIDQTLALLAAQGAARAGAARTTGQEIAASLGVMALAGAVVATVLG
jgi:hypothetical protein